MATQELLIDVRSAPEFASGALTSDMAPTVNIEYLVIDQLAQIYAARGITVSTNDHITLYCRSGRRSGIALQTLRSMGYLNVRDIGSLEDARRVLDREQVERQLEGELEGQVQDSAAEVGEGEEREIKNRNKSFSALVDGLNKLEE